MNNKELETINSKINNNNYTILPSEISIGEVYKIPYKGDLNIDGYEIGYLYLKPNTGIKEHTHINDVERYRCLEGCLKVFGKEMDINICSINESHCIDKVDKLTIIETIKINKDKISNLNTIDNNLFNNIINK